MLVGDVQAEAIAALVADGKCNGLQHATQIMKRRLRGTQCVDDSPPGPAPQVAPEPDQASPAGRAFAAPLGEHTCHDLSGNDAAQGEIAIVVRITKLERIQPEEPGQVVIAYIVEIPAGPEIARCPRLDSSGARA